MPNGSAPKGRVSTAQAEWVVGVGNACLFVQAKTPKAAVDTVVRRSVPIRERKERPAGSRTSGVGPGGVPQQAKPEDNTRFVVLGMEKLEKSGDGETMPGGLGHNLGSLWVAVWANDNARLYVLKISVQVRFAPGFEKRLAPQSSTTCLEITWRS